MAVFPELGLTGYSVDDLFLQDALLDGVLAAIQQVVEASADLMSVLVVGAPARVALARLQLRRRHPPRRGARRRAEVLPAELPRVLRAPLVRPRRRHGRRVDRARRRDGAVRARTWCSRRTTCPGLALHVEVCEDMWVPVPPSARGRARGRHGAGQHQRQPHHGGPRRGPAAARPQRQRAVRGGVRLCGRGAGRVDDRPELGRPDDGLRVRRPARRERAVPRRAAPHRRRRRPRPAAPGAAAAGQLRRQPAYARRPPTTSARSSSPSRRPPATSGCGARSTASRSCPTTRRGSSSTATRPTTSRSPASSSASPRSARPKAVIGVSGGLDSTHALIVACKAMDRLGRPRSDVLAFTMPGFATGSTTKAYATRLSESLGVTFEELDIRPAAEQMLKDMGHPYADGEKVYDVTFENVQAGLRYDYLFRLANQRGGIVVGTGDLSELALGLVHLRRRRPDVALHRQRRRAEDAGAAPHPLGDQPRRVRGGQRGPRRDPRRRRSPPS